MLDLLSLVMRVTFRHIGAGSTQWISAVMEPLRFRHMEPLELKDTST